MVLALCILPCGKKYFSNIYKTEAVIYHVQRDVSKIGFFLQILGKIQIQPKINFVHDSVPFSIICKLFYKYLIRTVGTIGFTEKLVISGDFCNQEKVTLK